MVWLLTFLGFLYSVFPRQQPSVEELRQLFYEASENKKKAAVLFDKMSGYSGNEGILIAYKAGAYALKARYGANPLNKLKNVKKAQRYFSEAVQREGQNLEIRFMRYAVEVQTPKSLGLSKHVAEDKAILLDGLKRFPNSGFTPETARITRDFLRQNCACSEDENEILQHVKI